MQLLYTDEVNIDPAVADFFVYAGVAIPGDHAARLSAQIENLRMVHGYKPNDVLKFNTVERPKHVSPEVHREIKRQVIEAAAKHQVKLFASFLLHNIATSPQEARRNEINRIAYHFNCYLGRLGDAGLVLIDTFQDAGLSAHLREKFSVGLVDMPYSKTMRLTNILGFHVATIGTSHFCSVVDIVLGSLRFAVNERNNPTKAGVANTLLRQIVPLCVVGPYSGKVDEISVFFSPKVIRKQEYLDEYLKLRAFLAAGGIEMQQEPSSERNY